MARSVRHNNNRQQPSTANVVNVASAFDYITTLAMNPYYQRFLVPETDNKDNISISSLLSDDTPKEPQHQLQQHQHDDENKKDENKHKDPPEMILLDSGSEKEEEPQKKEPEVRRATRRSTRVAVDSMVSKEAEKEKEKEKPKPRARKPRATAAKKKVDGGEISTAKGVSNVIDATHGSNEKTPEQIAAELAERLKQQALAMNEQSSQPSEPSNIIPVSTSSSGPTPTPAQAHPQASPSGMRPSIMNLMNNDAPAQYYHPPPPHQQPPPPSFPPLPQQHLPPIHPHQVHNMMPNIQQPQISPEHMQQTQQELNSAPNSIPAQLPQQHLQASSQPAQPGQTVVIQDETATSTSAPTPAPASAPKAKGGRKRKADTAAGATGTAPKKGRKKATPAAAAAAAAAAATPAPPVVEELSFNEQMNRQLKQPNPESSVPPPTLLEVTDNENGTSEASKPLEAKDGADEVMKDAIDDTKSINSEEKPKEKPVVKEKDTKTTTFTTADDDTKPEEPIIALHVPLRTPSEGPGSAQVVFNVMKMCEDKFGWKAVHPNSTKFSADMFNDDDLDDEDDDMEVDDDEDGRLKEKKEETPQPPVKIDGRKLQKGKPKIGQYDYLDPFIDDSEMLWEEQRASTKDGFFVFWGPLVEEGTSARIERADGTVKRTRKRNTTAGAATAKKKPGPRAGTPKAATPASTAAPAVSSAPQSSSTLPSKNTQPPAAQPKQKKQPLPIAPLPVLPKP